MSTVIPAEVQYFITQWDNCTPEGSSYRETCSYACILPKLLVISWARPTNIISLLKVKPEEICTVTATINNTNTIKNTTVITITTITNTTTTTTINITTILLLLLL